MSLNEFVLIRTFCFVAQTLMGIFYHFHSVALIEDLPLESTYKKPLDFYNDADKGYSQVSVFQSISFAIRRIGEMTIDFSMDQRILTLGFHF